MRRGIARAVAIGTLAVAPAVALAADSTVYSADIDGTASIELKFTDGKDRVVKKVVARKLEYKSSAINCDFDGRTGRITVKGSWKVKDNGNFRVVGSFDGGDDPLAGGQLNVVGEATKRKVTGDVKFTYGKTGCQTEKVSFVARPPS